MIKLTKQEFDNMRMNTNYVLIKPDRLSNDEFITNGGLKLYIEIRGEHIEEHINVWGTVIKSPSGLYYENLEQGSLPWYTELEIEDGDKVLYDFVAASQCLAKLYDKEYEGDDGGRYFFYEGELYMFLRYSDLQLIKREDEITMLNGYVLISPVYEKINSSIFMPDHIRNRTSLRYGVVEYKGSMIKKYATNIPSEEEKTDYCFNIQIKDGKPLNIKNTDISVGDYIAFEPMSDIELEIGMHAKIQKKYFRMQRRDIICIIPKELIEKFSLRN